MDCTGAKILIFISIGLIHRQANSCFVSSFTSAGFERTIDGSSNLLMKIGFLNSEANDWKSCCTQGIVHELIAIFTTLLVMRRIVELDCCDRGDVVRVAEDKIDVFSLDLIEV